MPGLTSASSLAIFMFFAALMMTSFGQFAHQPINRNFEYRNSPNVQQHQQQQPFFNNIYNNGLQAPNNALPNHGQTNPNSNSGSIYFPMDSVYTKTLNPQPQTPVAAQMFDYQPQDAVNDAGNFGNNNGGSVETSFDDHVVVNSAPTSMPFDGKVYEPIESITEFSWNIFKNSRQQNPIANIVISPLLLQLTLSLLQYGATGQTFEQLSRVTNHIHPDQLNQISANVLAINSRNQLGMAAAIFADKSFGLNNSFVREAITRQVSVVPVDFSMPVETGYTINNWISNATNHNIQNMFKGEDSLDLRMLLTNAIYFRGFWKHTFNKTQRDRFYTNDKLYKEVTYMMNAPLLRTGDFRCSEGASGKWVEIPYEGNEFSMILIVPTIRHQLENLIRQMQPSDVSDIIHQLLYSYRSHVHLKIPKFSIETSISLIKPLLKMGLVDLFTTSARLPFLTTTHEPVKIDEILQQAVLKVDEVGTVATIVQTVGVITLSISDTPDEVSFDVDQPFLALIVDRRNKIPLFMSKIYDP